MRDQTLCAVLPFLVALNCAAAFSPPPPRMGCAHNSKGSPPSTLCFRWQSPTPPLLECGSKHPRIRFHALAGIQRFAKSLRQRTALGCSSESGDRSEIADQEQAKKSSEHAAIQRIKEGSGDDDSLFWFGALFEFGLGLTAILFGRILGINPLGPAFSLHPSALLLGLVWGLPLPALMLALYFRTSYPPIREIQAITEAFGRRLFRHKKTYHLLLFSCAAGFGEELLFRGVVQQGLAAVSASLLGVWAEWVSVVLVAVAYGAAHWMTPLYFLFSAAFSLLFSSMFIFSGGNIVVPMVAHTVYDFVAVFFTLQRLRRKSNRP